MGCLAPICPVQITKPKISPGVSLLLALAHEFVRNTNPIRKVESRRGIASHCEVKTSSKWDSETLESSKIKELFSVSLKRPWGMGRTSWVLSRCRQSTGFKIFLVNRRLNLCLWSLILPLHTPLEGLTPNPSMTSHRHWGSCEVSPKPPLPQAGQTPCPRLSSRALLQSWPSPNLLWFSNVFPVLGRPKLATASRCGLVSAEQEGITDASPISWLWSCWCSPGCCWPSLLPGDAGGLCSRNWLEWETRHRSKFSAL